MQWMYSTLLPDRNHLENLLIQNIAGRLPENSRRWRARRTSGLQQKKEEIEERVFSGRKKVSVETNDIRWGQY